jgi:ABC-type sugar transport system ATPase subunit
MARIELEHITKVYPGGVRAVNDLSLDVPNGDFMVFVGPPAPASPPPCG